MKNFYLLIAAIIVCACGGESHNSEEPTVEEKVASALAKYFETQALDCSVVSVECLDTLYEAMPKNDPIYVELMHKSDSAGKAELEETLRNMKKENYIMHTTLGASSAYWNVAMEYKRQYKGPVESYVYRCIVKSSSYELKKDVEGLLYLVDTAYTKVVSVPIDYIELRELSTLY
jgi:hypothetical protein